MDPMHISDEIMIRLDGKITISFTSNPLHESRIPTFELLQKKVIGVQLSYAHCGEQDFGIDPMKAAFEAGEDCIIRKVPIELIDTYDDVTILKYGNATIHPRMIEIAKNIGMTGYWNSDNLVICARNEYKQIIKSILDFIKPNEVKFGSRTVFGGKNLLILPV